MNTTMPSTATNSPAALPAQLTNENQRDNGQRPSQMNEERELVLRSIRRDQQAFAQLYDRFVDKIFKYIYYRVNSKTEAEDLTAHVFLKAWEAIGNYRWTDRPFGAWLYRIAHNIVVDHFRIHRETTSLDDVISTEHIGTNFEDVVEQRLTADRLRSGLSRLTHDQQQVIILKFLEGYSTAEIAAILGKQEGAVRTLQHRALLRLTTILSQHAEEF